MVKRTRDFFQSLRPLLGDRLAYWIYDNRIGLAGAIVSLALIIILVKLNGGPLPDSGECGMGPIRWDC